MSRHQLMSLEASLVAFGVATLVLCRDNSLSHFNFIFSNMSWLQGASLVATSISRSDINFCRDITMLSRHHSFSLWLILSCLPCDPCRDLHQIPSVFLMSRRHSWTMQTQNCNINQPVVFIFSLPFELHFYSTNCYIFLLLFLLSSTLPANNKLVSFFIFLHINYSFSDENQTEKWIKNR